MLAISSNEEVGYLGSRLHCIFLRVFAFFQGRKDQMLIRRLSEGVIGGGYKPEGVIGGGIKVLIRFSPLLAFICVVITINEGVIGG